MVDVVIIIDAVHDFLDPNGIFTQEYGVNPCLPLINLKHTLNEIIATAEDAHKHNESKNDCLFDSVRAKSIITVTSHYKYNQFGRHNSTLSNLCTTKKGREIILTTSKKSFTLIKTTNYILDCINQKVRSKFLDIIQHKRVLICGVTLPHCVQKSAMQLVNHCQKVIIAKNAVAMKQTTQEHKNNSNNYKDKIYDNLHNAGVEIINDWKILFHNKRDAKIPKLYYVNGSIPSYRIQLALYFKNIEYEARRMYVMSTPKPTRTKEYLSMNPRGQTPVLQFDNKNTMRESLAILHMLDKIYGITHKNEDRFKEGFIYSLMQESERLRLILKPVSKFYDREFLQLIENEDETAINDTINGFEKIEYELMFFEKNYGPKKYNEFIGGFNVVTMADFSFYPILHFLIQRGMPIDCKNTKYPKLKMYFNKMKDILFVEKASPFNWTNTRMKGTNWGKANQVRMKYRKINKSVKIKQTVIDKLGVLINFISNYKFEDEKKHIDEKTYEKTDEKKRDKLCNLGVGDTELRYNILSDDIKNKAFYRLKNEIEWHKMRHKSGFVPRLVCNQGMIYESNHNISFEPIYRHPATEQPKLVSFTPFVDTIRKICEKQVGHILNHALIQYYRNGNDYISDHSDKTIDVDRNSNIVNFSVGATRLMILKKKKETKNDNTMYNVKNNQRYDLLNNSLFILGIKTNQYMYHTIKRDNRENFLKRKDELAFNGERISITFRKICTFKSITNPINILIGQGSKSPNKYCIINVLHKEKKIIFEKDKVNFKGIGNNDEYEKEFKQIIYAFGDENMKAASFDWVKTYGKGFNVIF